MSSFRTSETDQKYAGYRLNLEPTTECLLCKKPALQTFTHWKIVENSFPYDRIAKIHHMLIPIRHIKERDLTDEEWEELNTLKEGYIGNTYEFILEAAVKTKTIPAHFHLHVIVLK